jgi:iron complex transport system permease protein
LFCILFKNQLKISLNFLVLTFVLIALTAVSLIIVPEIINPFSAIESDWFIFKMYRLPKTITALMVGSALSVSGFILQQLFRNQLAGPYILGVSSGASLMVAIVLVLGINTWPLLGHISLSLAGILGATLILLLISSLSLKYGYGSIILLFGVIISMITGAFQSLLVSLATAEEIKNLSLWSMGSFNQVIGTDLILLIIAVVIGLIWAYSLMNPLSVMILGDEVANSMGVNTRKTSFQLLICTGLLTGVATAYCGPIAFVGIAIPNLVKIVFKSVQFKTLLIANCLLGSTMTILGDIISSLDIWGFQIPINVTTSLIGGPFVIYILFNSFKK